MTYYCSDEALYSPLAKGEDEKPVLPHDWRDYPALKPSKLEGVKPPNDSVLVRTGGNALQAIDRGSLEQKNVVAVTVPWNVDPGDTIFVRVPHDNSRMVTVQIPKGVLPGNVFLVKVPEPVVVTGIPVDLYDKTGTRIVPSQEVTSAHPVVAMGTSPSQEVLSSSGNAVPDDLLLEEGFEMVEQENQDVPKQEQENREIV